MRLPPFRFHRPDSVADATRVAAAAADRDDFYFVHGKDHLAAVLQIDRQQLTPLPQSAAV